MEELHTEQSAAELMLQRGVKVKCRAPLLFRLFGIKMITLVLRYSFGGTLHRVAIYYLKTGIPAAKLNDITTEEALVLMAKSGKGIYRAVACALLNGWVAGYLFTPLLAWYLKWSLHPNTVMVLMNLLIAHGGLAPFMTTTRYIRGMKITGPNLGQKTKGS